MGYDLHEPLPDHSSLTRIRDRFGLVVFREFFERIVQLCVEAGLVWGEELYFDATKVDANASLDSIAPRFYVEEHLGEVFTVEEPPNVEQEDKVSTARAGSRRWPSLRTSPRRRPHSPRRMAQKTTGSPETDARDASKGRMVSAQGDFLASSTDPDSPMKRRDSKGSHLGYYTHYVVDGGKSRIILNALVTPLSSREPTDARPTLAHQPPGRSLLGKLPVTPPTVPPRT